MHLPTITLLSLLLISPALAKEPPCQTTLQDAIDMAQKAVAQDDSLIFTEYPKDESKKLVDLYNSEPPKTNEKADTIITLADPKGNTLVGMVKNKCVYKALRIPSDAWDIELEKALGKKS